MSRSEACLLIALVFGAAWPTAAWPADLGHAASPAEIAAWDIDVRPDGAGLPPGSGSVSDGEVIFQARCASCHGDFGESQQYMALAGGVGSLATTAPQRTVGSKLDHATTLFDYINRAMPFADSKTLSANEVYAVTAYVLNLNDILPADAVLDEHSLPLVKMPNRDGFTLQHGFGRQNGKPDTSNTACMRNCPAETTIQSRMPPGFVEQFYGDISDDFRRYDARSVAARMAPPAACTAGGAGCDRQPGPDQLIVQYSCTVCHAIDSKLVGPAYQDVSARYAGKAGAEIYLLNKVKAGGVGVWGEIPMPSQATVPEAELKAIIRWILELKK